MPQIDTYCTADDVISRLSPAGVLYACGDSSEATIADDAVQRVLNAGLAEAKRIVDAAVQGIVRVPYSQDSTNLNGDLRALATKIAAADVAHRGGRGTRQELLDDAADAKRELREIMQGKRRVIGMTYPGDGFITIERRFGAPMIARR